MVLKERLAALKKRIPPQTRLIAVSKTHPASSILEAYECGQRVFGENKVQELCAKEEELPKDIEWHMIGHLQSNKVKYIAPFVALIHGVDSFKLLRTIDKEGRKNKRVIPCLLQVHIAEESTKFGFSPEELREMLAAGAWRELEFVELRGLMGMGTFTEEKAQVQREFHSLKVLFDEVRMQYFADRAAFKELSMGMSDDFELAIAEGSTLVRVGSALFGARDYNL
ncbi:YggS family pyridoxal phosphate-dependent enzyme [Geofilum rhodophaeum]|uniref:YggS family pyridoxal phosphate-dependent enzyme n=1 Tax=Geofilum rhodophaeum TaxID=1965019 RepID=UPI000B52443C|nr:YggS family pyridoxal phosphate-dependent enzyme [Geofilum rhodophaeum]